VRSSVSIMTNITTINLTVDPAFVAKEKLVDPSLFCDGSSLAGGTDPTAGGFSDLTGVTFFVTNGSRLDGRVCREMADEFAPLKFFSSVHGMEHDRLFIEFNVYEPEISSFGLQEKVAVYENCMDQLEKFQDDQMKVVNDKFDKLYTDFVYMALHLEEKPSPSYYPIGKAVEKSIQGRLFARIVHGNEGRVLTDVDAHNPSAKVDYTSALQQLQNVNFSLLAELKSNKDASVETVMEILHLEGPLTEKLGLNKLQPNANQLMIPIHRSSDKFVLGATALSLALDVSSFRVWRIRVNIANKISTLRDVFVPLAQPFPLRFIALISVDDYEVLGADDQVVVDGNAASFLNVDDAELNIPQ
nr:hypothetical protein [Tanacetum cinerariifolium]